MNQDKKIIGYRIQNPVEAHFIGQDEDGFFFYTDGTDEPPYPVDRSTAYRLAAEYFDSGLAQEGVYDDSRIEIVPVFAPVKTPLQNAASELGALLTSLTKRHGVKLDLTPEQIERQIAIELEAFGASR